MLALLRTMLRIRRLEEAVVTFAEDPSKPIRGHVHVSIGQEAAAVGACAALEPHDYVFTTHRNHGHVLARGGDPTRILAEILGREAGYSHGRAGGFHVAAPQLGILHTSAIVGGSVALAAGAAFAARRLPDPKRVALVFFGDGAMEEGVFSETLNIAQLWRLPLVLFMENNSVSPAERSGRGSPTSEHSASALSDVPRAYGLRTECVDGTDLDQVLAAAREAVSFARSGEGPCFVESRTSRWPGNYASSPTLALGGATDLTWAFSPASVPEPLHRWAESSDPVLRLARRLVERDGASHDALLSIDAEVRAEIEAARAAALASPEPDASTAAEFVLAPPL